MTQHKEDTRGEGAFTLRSFLVEAYIVACRMICVGAAGPRDALDMLEVQVAIIATASADGKVPVSDPTFRLRIERMLPAAHRAICGFAAGRIGDRASVNAEKFADYMLPLLPEVARAGLVAEA